MFNRISLTGRLLHSITCNVINTKTEVVISLAVTKDTPNESGEYETYFFDCIIAPELVTGELGDCSKGTMISIEGYLKSSVIEKNERKELVISIITEKFKILEKCEGL